MERDCNEIKVRSPKRGVEIVCAALFIVALAFFGVWLFTREGLTVYGILSAALMLGIFTLSLGLAVPRAFEFFKGNHKSSNYRTGDRSEKRNRYSKPIRIIIAVLCARIFTVILAYVFAMLFTKCHGSIFNTLEVIWNKPGIDAEYYFQIAENWYITETSQMYNIVFLPLYPILIRLFNLLFNNSFISASLINTICSCAASVVLYRLALMDTGRRSAKFAVVFAFAIPSAIFFIAPLGEALFLLLSASTLLALRKRRFPLAALFGALASFSRLSGILLVVPFIAEAVSYAVEIRRENGKKLLAKNLLIISGSLVLFFAGSFAYLLINKLLWNDWFKFIEFKRDVWHQGFDFFFGSFSQHTDLFINTIGTNNAEAFGLCLPNILFMSGALAVFAFSARTLRTSYTLYFAAYFAAACGASWLLSAPRYMAALAVLPIALTHLCEGRDDGVALSRARFKTSIVTVLFIIGQVFYLIMYIINYNVF